MQKMITKEIERKAPRLYATDGQGKEAVAVAHYFSMNGWDWYMTEYDPETREAFGYVKSPYLSQFGPGRDGEFGYFNLDEFDQINRKHGFEIVEREIYWTPCKLAEIA